MAKPYSVVRCIYERVRDKVFYLTHNNNALDTLVTDNRVLARSIANDIHDAPPIWSYNASVQAVAQQLKRIEGHKVKEPTKDHYRSRQRGGLKLAQLISTCIKNNREPTFSEVSGIVRLFRQVHYITSAENQTLKKWMGNDKKLEIKYTHHEAYKMAKIDLIKIDDDLFTRRGRKTPLWIKHKKDKYLPLIKQANNRII